MPFPDNEMHKIVSTLNKVFKVTSLHLKGYDENFICKLHIVAECSQFMTTFEFMNDIYFNKEEEIVISNIFSL